MLKKKLISRLRDIAVASAGHSSPRDRLTAQWLLWFFDRDTIPEFEITGISPYLPQLLIDAWEMMRHSEEQEAAQFRAAFRATLDLGETDELPDLLDPQSGMSRFSVILNLTTFISTHMYRHDEFGKVVADQVRYHLEAQDMIIRQALETFTRLVYRPSLRGVIEACPQRGMSGTFHLTTLRSMVSAGRIMLTFARDGEREGQEYSVSFVADESDELGVRTGLQGLTTSYKRAVAMIEEVTQLYLEWSKTENPSSFYTADKHVYMA